MQSIELWGRSSSHFTRTARIFALELGVPHIFVPVFDLGSLDVEAYAGNPALKVPILVDEQGPLFGTENICRELVRRSGAGAGVVLRGDASHRVVANAEELVLHVMSTEVALVMARESGATSPPKARRSIQASLDALDGSVDAALGLLPAGRRLSFFEVTLFCLLEHLPFRRVLDVSHWQRLEAFRHQFSERAVAQETTYHFDAAPEGARASTAHLTTEMREQERGSASSRPLDYRAK